MQRAVSLKWRFSSRLLELTNKERLQLVGESQKWSQSLTGKVALAIAFHYKVQTGFHKGCGTLSWSLTRVVERRASTVLLICRIRWMFCFVHTFNFLEMLIISRISVSITCKSIKRNNDDGFSVSFEFASSESVFERKKIPKMTWKCDDIITLQTNMVKRCDKHPFLLGFLLCPP